MSASRVDLATFEVVAHEVVDVQSLVNAVGRHFRVERGCRGQEGSCREVEFVEVINVPL